MKCPRHRLRPSFVRSARIFTLVGLALPVCLLVFANSTIAQVGGQEPSPAEPPATAMAPDAFLPQIEAALQGVTTRDVAALSKALHIGEGLEATAPGGPYNTLASVGDVDGDGVPEMVLKWAIPDITAGADVAPAPESSPLWGVYLLSWDGAHWKASRLMTGVEEFTPILINLGPPVGQALAVVIPEGDSQVAYPAIFQLKEHAAKLLWDAQADDSRYEPLLQGRVIFQDHPDAPTEMIVTGRADPGLLQVDPKGRG